MHRTILSTVFLLLLAWPAAAEDTDAVVLPGESRAATGRLAEARKQRLAKNFRGALALYQAILDAPGDDLATLKDGRCVSARRQAHLGIIRMGPFTWSIYRTKAEPLAKRLLEEAEKNDDVLPLHRIVRDAFCTRQAVTALERLGDWAFLRGRFVEAEEWWSLLAPLVSLSPWDLDEAALSYPDPSPEVAARARAKQLLARIYRGVPGWKGTLAGFLKLHPKAEGRLAGRSGFYADILTQVAEERSKRAAPPDPDFPTFSGALTRNRVSVASPRVLDELGRLGRGGPTWRFDLKKRSPLVGLPQPLVKRDVTAARRFAFYPIVVDRHAIVADARYVAAYDLTTGKAQTWYDSQEHHGGMEPRLDLPAPLDLRYTLTAAEGCVFARLGTQTVRDIRPRAAGGARVDTESALVCLSMKPGPTGDRRKWAVVPIDPVRREYAVFEGSPVVSDGRVYIAATRFEGDRVITAIHCYPTHPEETAPLPLWRTDVCATRELQPDIGDASALFRRRARHHLLTVAGSQVVYCSHSGAVVSLNARTGQRSWAMRYPRRDVQEPEDDPGLRDLAPVVYAAGRLFVAPNDSEHVFCLDPMTGETIWSRERLDVVHLLGVASGRLIFSTYRNPAQGRLNAGGLRAVRSIDGADDLGWILPDDGGGLLPFGRGALVGDLVLWPTSRRSCPVVAVGQADGRQPDNPTLLHRLPAGNLVYAGGCLLVADQTTLHAFVPEEWLGEEVMTGAPEMEMVLRHPAWR